MSACLAALLDRTDRSPDEDDRLIHLAHASRLHWDTVGDDQHRAIGEWQVSRVYSTLGRGEPAVFHATRCLDYAGRPGVADWVVRRSRHADRRRLTGRLSGVTAGEQP